MNTTTQALEEDNDRHTADLILKVAAVKQAALSIHDEVSEHNRLLSNMVRRRKTKIDGENGEDSAGIIIVIVLKPVPPFLFGRSVYM